MPLKNWKKKRPNDEEAHEQSENEHEARFIEHVSSCRELAVFLYRPGLSALVARVWEIISCDARRHRSGNRFQWPVE